MTVPSTPSRHRALSQPGSPTRCGPAPRLPAGLAGLSQLGLVVGLLCAGTAATAQADPNFADPQRYQPLLVRLVERTMPLQVLDGLYAANARVGQIKVEVQGAGAPADGVSPVTITVRVFDLDGAVIEAPVLVTIEHTGTARVLLPDNSTDELGPGYKDADRRVPGTQLRVVGGQASFSMIAPSQPEDVLLRIYAGQAEVSGSIGFAPDLREMIGVGLIEGVLKVGRRSGNVTLAPAGLDDGFETELKHWSRAFNADQSAAAVRGAVFLKGKISGETLLTLSYDSDKDTRATLLRDIRPEEFYPVYGDASIRSIDARSSSHLFVRVDQGRNFVLWGDFNTAEGVSAAGSGSLVAGTRLRQLGAYNRGVTGTRLHLERSDGYVNAYASHDTLRHRVEELRANGTSGPFAVGSTHAVEGSERIELLVRDRNNLDNVLSVTPLVRLNDYNFEPFSGRILLNRPVPSLDTQGNPMSLRVSYEVDQGGQAFWLSGVDGQVNLGDSATLGGSLVNDSNPSQHFNLASVNLGVKLGERSTLVAEVARSNSLVTLAPINPTLPGVTDLRSGVAARLVLEHESDQIKLRAYANRADAEFGNTAAGVTPGSQQTGAAVSYQATETVTLKGDVQDTHDTTSDARRTGATLGADYRLTPELVLSGGLRHIEETGRISNATSSIGANPDPGSAFGAGAGGGFTGAGSTTLVNLNGPVSSGSAPGSVPDLQANLAYLGANWALSPQVGVQAMVEQSVSGDNGRRAEIGASYLLAERARIYARAETQTGLSSRYSLDAAAHSNALALGVDTNYLPGANAFSEYRLRDSTDARTAQLASGLRNAWAVRDGVLLSGSVERLSILSGNGQNATAMTGGVDYTADEFWKGSTRLEWRRLDAPSAGTGGAARQQDSWLSTITVARKLDGDWTVLTRNYALATDNHGAINNGWQDRFQIGAAYRPVDNNRVDLLTKYEYKAEDNINADEAWRRVHVGAVQVNLHPSRPWWWSGRVAGKQVTEQFPTTPSVAGDITGVRDSYRALLLSGRLIYDVSDRIDLGAMASVMRGSAAAQNGSALQRSLGVEAGYLVQTNLWLSVGYNRTGFTDRDLSTDVTARGAYIRLRYKFGADLFEGSNREVNRTEPR